MSDILKRLEMAVKAIREQKCRVCGCTWAHACEGGCYWIEDDLCSKCAVKLGKDNKIC
jgi:hypothetical protein